MMKLTLSPGSPFVRKVRIVAAMKGLSDQVEELHADTVPEANQALRSKNPLGKIPTLALDDGRVVYDSHVICEYLDALSPAPKLFPADLDARLETLTLAALADGLAEAAVLCVYESRFRPPELWCQEWVDRQQAKVDAALDALEAKVPVWQDHPDYGHVSLATALGFLDARQEGKWRSNRPNLVAWLDRFTATVPSWATTEPPKA